MLSNSVATWSEPQVVVWLVSALRRVIRETSLIEGHASRELEEVRGEMWQSWGALLK